MIRRSLLLTISFGFLSVITTLALHATRADDCPNVERDLSKDCPLASDAIEGYANCAAVKTSLDCGKKIVKVRSPDNSLTKVASGKKVIILTKDETIETPAGPITIPVPIVTPCYTYDYCEWNALTGECQLAGSGTVWQYSTATVNCS